jgi:glc operon protein GlcG
MKLKLISVTLLLSVIAGAAGPTEITERKTLTLDGARRAIAAAVAQAHKNHAGGVIAVVDDGGNLMALERVDGTFAAGANISIGKARTAALFQKATQAFEEIIAKGRTAMVALNDFTPLQGGVPITVDGQIVGAVGVSGAANADQDVELAMTAAAAVSTAAPSVTFFDSTQVQAAFDKGAVLFNQGESYMVHASRRENPGMAEIHTKDADIVYVMDGTATLITGGTPVDVKPTEPDELRGSSISGGEPHELKKGDIIIVPAGVPHWFKEVSNPFLYYVVKAR